QAEDGIRDWSVTGVQTCALPICSVPHLATRPSAVNNGPSMIQGTRPAAEDNPVVIEVPANDSDPNNNLNSSSVTIASGPANGAEIGRASCRESGWSGEGTVSVET